MIPTRTTRASPSSDLYKKHHQGFRVREAYIKDIEIESVGLHLGRSEIYDPEYGNPDDSRQEDRSRALVAITKRCRMVIQFSSVYLLKRNSAAKTDMKIGPEGVSEKSSRHF